RENFMAHSGVLLGHQPEKSKQLFARCRKDQVPIYRMKLRTVGIRSKPTPLGGGGALSRVISNDLHTGIMIMSE
ncbi:hypothetical protein PROFUN_11323, partial [Planoprotostelium fungivorum]